MLLVLSKKLEAVVDCGRGGIGEDWMPDAELDSWDWSECGRAG